MPYRMNPVGVDPRESCAFAREWVRRSALNVRGPSPRTPLVRLVGACLLPCGHGR